MSSLGTLLKSFIFGVGLEGLAHVLRRIGPLDAAVEAFGVLAEDDDVDLRLLEAALAVLADEVERVALEGDAGADADVEVEVLPHGDDRAVVGEALALQRGVELGVGLVLRLGGDRAEEAELVLL